MAVILPEIIIKIQVILPVIPFLQTGKITCSEKKSDGDKPYLDLKYGLKFILNLPMEG
jgi:hypothetical protein